MVSFDPHGRDGSVTLDSGPRPIFYACAELGPAFRADDQTRETVFASLERKVADEVYKHYMEVKDHDDL